MALIARTLHHAELPHVDPKIHTPSQVVDMLFTCFLSARDPKDERLRVGHSNIILLPTNKLFHPKRLLYWALRDVYLIGLATEPLTVHGLTLSPLGQVIHDMAHAFSIINIKNEKLTGNTAIFWKKITQDIPQEITYKTLCILQKERVQLLKRKEKAFQKLLMCLFENVQNDKKACAALFFAIHEAGIDAWPYPSFITDDFKASVDSFLEEAKGRFEHYYAPSFETSPITGELQSPLNTVLETLNKSEKSPTHFGVKNHGAVLEVHELGCWGPFYHFLETKKWLFDEAQDPRRIVHWATGDTKFSSDVPRPTDDEGACAYIDETRDGILEILDYGREAFAKVFEQESTQEGSVLGEITQEFSEAQSRFNKEIAVFSDQPWFSELQEAID